MATFPLVPDEKYKGYVKFEAVGGGGGGGTARIYLPQGVQFQDGAMYEGAELGYAGMQVMGAVQGGLPTGKNISQITGDIINQAQQDAGQVAKMVASQVGGAAVSGGLGVAPNPNRRSIFKDVNLRTFNFTFNMAPASQAEAEAIKEIVSFFRTNLYPEKQGDALYRFPTKILTTIEYDGKAAAPKILQSYLTNVTTTYNPRSGSFFRGGYFNETQLTISLQEERTLTKQDIEEGY